MSESPQQKTEAQLAKERAFLSCCTLCIHHQWGRCNPRGGRSCNFAHWLNDLRPPEEGPAAWWKIWQKGEVDICFWPTYRPSSNSLDRFRCQFQWEREHWIHGIPAWAWGRAVKIGLVTKDDAPKAVPTDYDWPRLQQEWSRRKQEG